MLGLLESQENTNAFDLTWRNYLPSVSLLCSCLPLFGRRQDILLNDDHYNESTGQPLPYNDFYQTTHPMDQDFDDLLLIANAENEPLKSDLADKVVNPPQDIDKATGMYTPQSMRSDEESGTTISKTAPSILDDKLQDLTEKLVFIRNNMNKGSLKDQDETACPMAKRTPKVAAPVDYHYQRKSSMVSLASNDYSHRRLSYSLAPDLCMHGDTLDSPSARLPTFYSYFDDDDGDDDDEDSDVEEMTGIQDVVFQFGRKWFG